jgi:hypothetical protein
VNERRTEGAPSCRSMVLSLLITYSRGRPFIMRFRQLCCLQYDPVSAHGSRWFRGSKEQPNKQASASCKTPIEVLRGCRPLFGSSRQIHEDRS